MACVLTCTSPSPGGGGGSTLEISSFRSETRRSARIREFPAGEGNGRAKGLKPLTARRQPRWFAKFEGAQAGSPASTRHTFCPPKPKELEIAVLILASRATFGTTSSGIAGSGTL